MDRRPVLDDDALAEGFASARLPNGAFGHEEHVRAAFLYLTRTGDFGEAAVRFRRDLRRFAAAHGAAGKYHETLTWAYLALINERAHGTTFSSSAAFLRLHPELLDQKEGLLSRYYDLGSVARSDRARQVFLLPRRDPSGREP
ncbi:MAG TPA: hypothetical protein VE964_12860 [Myxococcales bacterium]|nr:hypothetical protein [Myxococcales bacterium]